MELDGIYQTDVLSVLRFLEDESVDCIVTSPPYWQLRNYELELILFGGDPHCHHVFDKYKYCMKCGKCSGSKGACCLRQKQHGFLEI